MKKFLVISDAPILKKENKFFAYAPYINEMDIWMKYVETTFFCPTKYDKKLLLKEIRTPFFLVTSPRLIFNSIQAIVKSLLLTPIVFIKLILAMSKADHIHLRCPGNIALLACIVQILFPSKPKTVKYAGNWDPKSKQPFSYRLQKKILSNTFLTRNCKVLVYGNWKNQSKNILPFFTASYKYNEIEKVPKKTLKSKIKFIFVGNFSKGKQPLLSVKVVEQLIISGFKNVELNMYGNGVEFEKTKEYVIQHGLENYVCFHGNQPKEEVKKAYQESHFLIFISKSEGWPKVVAEAMFWGCLPIASNVSCVENMLGYGKRGTVLDPNVTSNEIVEVVKQYLKNEEKYQKEVALAKDWSHQYTLNKFEEEIKKFV
jgi:glycosyltransferase involved in cell wall biosynthesis